MNETPHQTPEPVVDPALDESADPFVRFAEWMVDAEKHEPNDPSAASVATATAEGIPSVRMVLVRGIDPRGFVFYTNYESQKGQELLSNPHAALCFHWKSLRRQVRIQGPVESVTEQEADDYFQSRPRDSRIGAWASRQSRPMTGRFELESRIAEYGIKFMIGKVPRPPHWSGFRVIPHRIEFWKDRPFRLHDRLIYRRDSVNSPWATERLFP